MGNPNTGNNMVKAEDQERWTHRGQIGQISGVTVMLTDLTTARQTGFKPRERKSI